MADLVDSAEILNAKIEQMIAFATQNDAKFRRFQRLEMGLLGIRSIDKLLQAIVTNCKTDCQLDAVSLLLVDPEYDIRRLTADTCATSQAQIQIVESPSELHKFVADKQVKLVKYDAEKYSALFLQDDVQVQSIAIMPLWSNDCFLGCLVFGSHDSARYASNLETLFLTHLGAVIAVCIQNTLNHTRLQHLGLTDSLTQVHNRRYFDERLTEEVSKVQRTNSALGCLYLDIDFFKQVNDEHGHAAGDEVLAMVAVAMQKELRPVDVLARYGGEEFVGLLVETNYESALVVAERIRKSIEALVIPLSQSNAHALQIQITMSIGVAVLDLTDTSESNGFAGSDLVSQADQALYTAKRSGRNRVCGWADLVQDKLA